LPLGGVEELLEGIDVPVLQQVARFCSRKRCTSAFPRRACVGALAHQEFEEQLGLVELPLGLRLDKMRGQTPRCGAAQKVLWSGALSVRKPGESIMLRHLDHHLVEEGADALGIGAVE